MLDPDHPMLPIIVRWRTYLPPDATSDIVAEAEFRQIIVNLETGLFDRLPEIVTAAVHQFAGDLHPNLYAVLVEIARVVSEGDEPGGQLLASFELRLQRYHQVAPGEPIADNIIPFDPP